MRVLTNNPARIRKKQGFTLVEIMVVILIIGIIAGLAFPAILASRSSARRASFINDLRQARGAFETAVLVNGYYPGDEGPASIPTGMEEDLNPIRWTDPTSVGGHWDWDYGVFGITAAVSVYNPTEGDAAMLKIDANIDDGNPNTGAFRERPGGYMLVIEE